MTMRCPHYTFTIIIYIYIYILSCNYVRMQLLNVAEKYILFHFLFESFALSHIVKGMRDKDVNVSVTATAA